MSAHSHPFSFNHPFVTVVIFFVMGVGVYFIAKKSTSAMCESSVPVASIFEYRNMSMIFIVTFSIISFILGCCGFVCCWFFGILVTDNHFICRQVAPTSTQVPPKTIGDLMMVHPFFRFRRSFLLFPGRRRKRRGVLALPPPPGESVRDKRRKSGQVKRFSDKGKFVEKMSPAMEERVASELYTDLHQMARNLGGTSISIKASFYEVPSCLEDHSSVRVKVCFS